MSKTLLRSALELRALPTRPSAVLPLPIRIRTTARAFNTTAQIIEPTQPQADEATIHGTRKRPQQKAPPPRTPPPLPSYAPSSVTRSSAEDAIPTSTPPIPKPQRDSHPASSPLPDSVRALLPLLAAQPGHYIRVHIHGFPYLVTAGDQVRLPFRMPGVQPGDVLRLNRASVLGSRDFTLQGGSNNGNAVAERPGGIKGGGGTGGAPGARYIDERLFECRAVVLGTESEPMRVKIKKKQRCRRKKHVRSKHRYTILRISEVKVNSAEEIEV